MIDNKKHNVYDEKGMLIPLVYHRKQTGKKSPYYTIKCGCCRESLKIYYDEDTLEINGVLASKESWKKVFLPLLGVNENE